MNSEKEARGRAWGGENIKREEKGKKRNKGRFVMFAIANGVSNATVDALKVPNATE